MSLQPTLPHSIPSGIRDNRHRGTVADFLKQKITSGCDLSVVSAYFTIYAFEELQHKLTSIQGLRFLFGEPRFLQSLDPTKTDKKSFKIEDDGLSLRNRLTQRRVARDCAAWIGAKVEIRSIAQSNFLHGKMYHTSNHGVQSAIVGSSNFTVRGLGLGNVNNIELNLEVDSKRDIEDLKVWFDELWDDESIVRDVKADVLLYLQQLYTNHAPEFIYYKTLFHLFERERAEEAASRLLEEKTGFLESGIWNALFEFQKDGVKGAVNKIQTHNGCILADSVGLGKTYEALAVIKFFELRNSRVLVLCPKKLRENWTIYQAQNNSSLNPFLDDRFAYTVLSHTDLSRGDGFSGDVNLATINWGNYDLVVIDESHNFRNNSKGRRDEEGKIITRTRYERVMDDIVKAGVKTKVLLLSATPVNNDLKDLRNQIYLLTEDNDAAFASSLKINSIKDTLGVAQRNFMEWAKQKSEERKTADLLDKLSASFFTLLDELTIARSRKHIVKYYQDSLDAIGNFPSRLKPISLSPEIDTKGKFPSYDQLNREIGRYQLALFNPFQYVRDEYKHRYTEDGVANFSQANREFYLIGMMKVNFLKRLESSVNSFQLSMRRTIDKIAALQNKLSQFQAMPVPDDEIDADDLDAMAGEDDEDLQDALEIGSKKKYQLEHLDVARWRNDLEHDRVQLVYLYELAQNVDQSRDAKLLELKSLIREKALNPPVNRAGRENKKLLVFTAFADTANYLYASLCDWAKTELHLETALVTGGQAGNKATFGRTEFNEILTNFSPVAKNRAKTKSLPQTGEIDLLIATDCISEGQNLQDCDTVINYDIHWNPVRLIQRFGRIDRIGSQNAAIQMVNFWPTDDLNKYINLKNRVEARMALVDLAATNQDDLLNVEELTELIEGDLKYRDKQLLRLKDEVLDLEDLTETVALNDFTLDDFRRDLLRYLESNRLALQEAPLGLYAVVPPDAAYPQIQPGVIFCLKQTGDTRGNESVNPLQPYFLAYVRDDGTVRYTFAQSKQVLDLLRILCVGQNAPHQQLCDAFDQQTGDGSDMAKYSALLDKAVASITQMFRKRAANALTAGRGGVLVPAAKQVTATTDFELITWIVIK